MKGYFFSLETLIAVVIMMSALFATHVNYTESDDGENKIYAGLGLLDDMNLLENKSDEFIESELEKLLDFDVKVSKDCTGGIVDYLVVEGVNKFRIIRVCY
ncbi:MAG: hypothetical protein KAU95_01085 [Candidatus Aenigmarchaeota archaeon]|nr:hypothetical protein [Candidatus Aenigmarchaeota archaeon]